MSCTHTHTPTICLHPRRLRRNMECLTYWRLFWLVLNTAVVNDAQNNLYRTKRGSEGNIQQPARPDQTWPGVVVVAVNIPSHSLTTTCLLHHNNNKKHIQTQCTITVHLFSIFWFFADPTIRMRMLIDIVNTSFLDHIYECTSKNVPPYLRIWGKCNSAFNTKFDEDFAWLILYATM